MEKTQSKEVAISQPSSIDRIQQAKAGLRIGDAEDKETKQTLATIFAMLGISGSKIPNQLEELVLMEFIREELQEFKIQEIRLAFTLALKGEFKTELNLFGEPFSVKFLLQVLNDFKIYRTAILKAEALRKFEEQKKGEVKMNNIQRVGAILDLLPKEFKDSLKGVGKPKENEGERKKLPFHDIHQEWLKRFDKLKLKYEIPKTGGMLIHRYGKPMDLQGFFRKKAEQLQMAKERNQDKL